MPPWKTRAVPGDAPDTPRAPGYSPDIERRRRPPAQEAADAVLCPGCTRVHGECLGRPRVLHEFSTGASAHGPRGALLTTVQASVEHRIGGVVEAGRPRPCLSLSQGRGRPPRSAARVRQLFLTGMSVRRYALSLVLLSAWWSRVMVSPPGSGQTTQMVVTPVLRSSETLSSLRGRCCSAAASR